MTEIALGYEGALALGRLIDQEAFLPAISRVKRDNCGKALSIVREPASCKAATALPPTTA